jgi:thioesterase domain-containing protein
MLELLAASSIAENSGVLIVAAVLVAIMLQRLLSASSAAPRTALSPRLHVSKTSGVVADLVEIPPLTDDPSAPYFVLFPGNPGAVHFYMRYAQRLHQESGGRLHLVILGHGSHSVSSAMGRMLNLKAQVDHKIEFVMHHLKQQRPHAPFILSGHSIGAYMAVEASHKLPSSSLLRAVLLFPTLARMAHTTNGKKLMNLFRFGRPFVWAAAHVVAMLPQSAQRAIVRWWMAEALQKAETHSSEEVEEAIESVCQLIHPSVAANALYMALHEMHEVTDLDHAKLSALEEKIVAYFGVQDHWVNDEDVDEIERTYTSAKVLRCKEGHKHAFVLNPRSAERVAQMTWAWIKNDVESLAKNVDGGSVAAEIAAPPSSSKSASKARAHSVSRK